MKIEYDKATADNPTPSNMVITFEDEEEWYTLVYGDSWIAKAIVANTSKGGIHWGEHVKNVMPVTAKDLNTEQLNLLEVIRGLIKK